MARPSSSYEESECRNRWNGRGRIKVEVENQLPQLLGHCVTVRNKYRVGFSTISGATREEPTSSEFI